MRRRTFLRTVLSGASFASLNHGSLQPWAMAGPSYPAPRYPTPPKVNAVGDLLANVRHIIRHERINARPGYGVTGGERVIVVVDSYVDPLVVEAFQIGFREAGCRVDRIVLDAPSAVWDSADVLELVVRKDRDNPTRLWNMRVPYLTDLFDGYDLSSRRTI